MTTPQLLAAYAALAERDVRLRPRFANDTLAAVWIGMTEPQRAEMRDGSGSMVVALSDECALALYFRAAVEWVRDVPRPHDFHTDQAIHQMRITIERADDAALCRHIAAWLDANEKEAT